VVLEVSKTDQIKYLYKIFPYSCFHSKIDARINNDNIVEGENIGS
jgi:hypothetical protein